MKKIIVSAVIVLGSLSMNATTKLTENVVLNVINLQENYKEIALDALPAEVKSTIEKSFPTSKLIKAFVNEKKEYKLELNTGETGTRHYVFTDAKGVIAKKY